MYLIKKHNGHKKSKQDSAETSDGCEDDDWRGREQAAIFVHAGNSLPDHKDQCVERAQENVDEELQEKLLVVVAYAIINPWAVMVHSGDTAFADGAMMAKRWLYRVALAAVLRDHGL